MPALTQDGDRSAIMFMDDTVHSGTSHLPTKAADEYSTAWITLSLRPKARCILKLYSGCLDEAWWRGLLNA